MELIHKNVLTGWLRSSQHLWKVGAGKVVGSIRRIAVCFPFERTGNYIMLLFLGR